MIFTMAGLWLVPTYATVTLLRCSTGKAKLKVWDPSIRWPAGWVRSRVLGLAAAAGQAAADQPDTVTDSRGGTC